MGRRITQSIRIRPLDRHAAPCQSPAGIQYARVPWGKGRHHSRGLGSIVRPYVRETSSRYQPPPPHHTKPRVSNTSHKAKAPTRSHRHPIHRFLHPFSDHTLSPPPPESPPIQILPIPVALPHASLPAILPHHRLLSSHSTPWSPGTSSIAPPSRHNQWLGLFYCVGPRPLPPSSHFENYSPSTRVLYHTAARLFPRPGNFPPLYTYLPPPLLSSIASRGLLPGRPPTQLRPLRFPPPFFSSSPPSRLIHHHGGVVRGRVRGGERRTSRLEQLLLPCHVLVVRRGGRTRKLRGG